MKIKVKFIGIDYRTLKRVSFTKMIETHIDFVDKVVPTKTIMLNDKPFTFSKTTLTAKQQVDEWLEMQSEILNDIIHDPKRELKCIINWEVLSVGNEVIEKPKRLSEVEKIGLVFEVLQKKNNEEFSDLFKNTFLHCYLTLKDDLKGVGLDKKIRIVLNSMDLSMQAAVKAYKDMAEVIGYNKPLKQISENTLS